MIAIHTQKPPVVLSNDLCFRLAHGDADILEFLERGELEIRLSTATLLALLERAGGAEERARIRRFSQGYPVLSVGPMTSARAVEILTHQEGVHTLTALDAVTAATAIAHEIPLLTGTPDAYAGIPELRVLSLG